MSNLHRRKRSLAVHGITALAMAGIGCASPARPEPPVETPRQHADSGFELPETGPAAFPVGGGPVVGIDEAHHNYHTAEGRYRSFADLLRRDGYRVERADAVLDADSLSRFDLLVISNAIAEENIEGWALPNHAAFTEAEVEAADAWVRGGGRLLLIADHMPMPGAAATLARAFGVLFHDGYAFNADGSTRMTFRREDGTLADHGVTAPPVDRVTTFTGQAFRLVGGIDADPLLYLSSGAYLLLPTRASEFAADTPRIPADELLQGVLVRHGAGRVAVFGEAAAFSAQISAAGNPMGMNHPEAPHNARFLLNVLGWLTAAVPELQ